MINLLKETDWVLRKHAKSPKTIKCVCNAEGKIKVADFFAAAWKVVYDNRSGKMIIDPTLKIVGKSWWLERRIVNNVEGWVFRRKPDIPQVPAGEFSVLNERGQDFQVLEDTIELTPLEFEPE